MIAIQYCLLHGEIHEITSCYGAKGSSPLLQKPTTGPNRNLVKSASYITAYFRDVYFPAIQVSVSKQASVHTVSKAKFRNNFFRRLLIHGAT
jgi:hypothetical protein